MGYSENPANSKPDKVWSGKELTEEMAKETGKKFESPVGANILRQLKTQLQDKPEHLTYGELQLPLDALVFYRSESNPATGIHEEYGKQIVTEYARQQKLRDKEGKPAGFWWPSELSEVIIGQVGRGCHSDIGAQIINTLRAKFKANKTLQSASYLGVDVPRTAIVECRTEKGSMGHAIDSVYGQKLADAYIVSNKGKTPNRGESSWRINCTTDNEPQR